MTTQADQTVPAGDAEDESVADELDEATPSILAPVRDRALAWWLLIGGFIGLIASATLLIEKIKLLSDPGYVPSCSINPVLSCGSVMNTDQAALFGFANPIIGVAAFPVVITTAVVLLTGARLPRWYWAGLQVGVTAGVAFVAWLFFQSLYRIGALCPYCMVVWVVVLPTFWYVTLRNAQSGVFGRSIAESRLTRWISSFSAPLLAVVYLGVIIAIGDRFWYYWKTLI